MTPENESILKNQTSLDIGIDSGLIRNATELAGRALLVILFVAAGAGKITGYAGTQAYMASHGVPGALLPLVILTELGGSAAILLGWHTRIVAFLLAGFTMIAALIFHHHLADQTQFIMFFKDVSITGAFLLLIANGAGAWSLDARRTR